MCLMKHHAKNSCVVMKVQLHAFLNWLLTGASGKFQPPATLPQEKGSSGIRHTGGLVDTRIDVGVVEV
jgi:hypothetical protein